MTMFSLLLVLAFTTVHLDIVTLPFNNDIRVALTPTGRADMKRQGTVTQVKIEIDRIQTAMARGTVANTYVVWSVSPEGILLPRV